MTAGDAQAQVRDPVPLYGWLRGFLIAYAVCAAAVTAGNAAYYHISQGDPYYAPETPESIAVALGLAGAAFFTVAIFIVCVVLTCRLTFRMMKNLRIVGSSYPTISPGWAVGWYFIPFANLYMPMKAVSEIWDGTVDQIGETGRSPGGLIGFWWACWLLGNICDTIAERVAGGGGFREPVMPSTEALYAAIGIWILGALFSIGACILMILLFGKLARAQQHMVRTAAF